MRGRGGRGEEGGVGGEEVRVEEVTQTCCHVNGASW